MRERSVRTDNLTMAAARERNVYGRSLNCFQDQPDMYWMTDANLVYPYQECRSAVDCLDYDPCTAEICTGPSHPQPYSCLYTGIAQQFPNGSFSALCCRKSAVTSSAFVAYKSGPISRRLQLLQQSRHSERALPRNTYITYTVSYWNTQITCLRYWTSAHPAWLCDRTKDGCYFTQYTSIGLASGANCAELCTMSSTCINTDEDGNCLYMEYCVAWQWERLVGCLTITNLAFGPGLRIGNSSDYFFLTTPNYEYGMEYPDQNAAVNQILTTACSAEQQARPADPFNYARGTVLTGLLYGSDCNANSQATFGIPGPEARSVQCVESDEQTLDSSAITGYTGRCIEINASCTSDADCAGSNDACYEWHCVQTLCTASTIALVDCSTKYVQINSTTCAWGPVLQVDPNDNSKCICQYALQQSCAPGSGPAICYESGILVCPGGCTTDEDCYAGDPSCILHVGGIMLNLCFCFQAACLRSMQCTTDDNCTNNLPAISPCASWWCSAPPFVCMPYDTNSCPSEISVHDNNCKIYPTCSGVNGCDKFYSKPCPFGQVVLTCNGNVTGGMQCVECIDDGFSPLCNEFNYNNHVCYNHTCYNCLSDSDCDTSFCSTMSCVGMACVDIGGTPVQCPNQAGVDPETGVLACLSNASCSLSGDSCVYGTATYCPNASQPVLLSCHANGMPWVCRACDPISVSQEHGNYECLTFTIGADANILCDNNTLLCYYPDCIDPAMNCTAPETNCWRNVCADVSALQPAGYYSDVGCRSTYIGQTDANDYLSASCVTCDSSNGSVVCQELASALATAYPRNCVESTCNETLGECVTVISRRTVDGCSDELCNGEMCHGLPCCTWPL